MEFDMNLPQQLQAYSELEKRFPRSQKLYDKGLEIFETYGPNNNLQRLLKRAQAAPRAKHWGHLESQLKKLGLGRIEAHEKVPATSTEREMVQEKVVSSPVAVNFAAPESLPDDLELLIRQNRELAQKRALLTNKLTPEEIGGDAKAIEQNKNIVEEIMEVVAQQEPLEDKIDQLKQQEKPAKSSENPIIFEDREKGELRLNDLYEMAIPDLVSVQDRIKKLKSNTEQRMPAYKKEASKLKGEKTIIKCNHAITVIDRVIADLKLASL